MDSTMNAMFGAYSVSQVVGGVFLVAVVAAFWFFYRGGWESGYEAGYQAAIVTKNGPVADEGY